MTVSDRHRKRLIRANAQGDGDVLSSDWVRLITGGPVGWVKSVNGDHATVWFPLPNRTDILPIAILKRIVP